MFVARVESFVLKRSSIGGGTHLGTKKGSNKFAEEVCTGGKERKLDALQHVHDLAEVLLGVAADLCAVGCGITLTQPTACSACSNHVAPRSIGEHRGEQGVVIANTKGVADLREDGGDDDYNDNNGCQS